MLAEPHGLRLRNDFVGLLCYGLNTMRFRASLAMTEQNLRSGNTGTATHIIR
jgi:hypothetical protein